LTFQDGADGAHERDGDEPVVVGCGDSVRLGTHGGGGGVGLLKRERENE
jgi:hypothetical protein